MTVAATTAPAERSTAAGAPETVQGSASSEPTAPGGGAELVEQDLLVEDVSIDGMCGVY